MIISGCRHFNYALSEAWNFRYAWLPGLYIFLLLGFSKYWKLNWCRMGQQWLFCLGLNFDTKYNTRGLWIQIPTQTLKHIFLSWSWKEIQETLATHIHHYGEKSEGFIQKSLSEKGARLHNINSSLGCAQAELQFWQNYCSCNCNCMI